MLGKNSKKGLKEKIVHMYTSLIQSEESSNHDNFWNDFFLLKANRTSLEQELAKIGDATTSKKIVRLLFEKSLDAIQDPNQLKILNGLITLCSISQYALSAAKTNFYQDGPNDVFVILFSSDQVHDRFMESICSLLFNPDIHCGIKSIVLKLLLIFCTAQTDIDSNIFIESFQSYQLFDALIDLLNTANHKDELRIMLLLIIFLNFKKPNTNPYIMKLSIIDNEIILNRYSKAIFNQLVKFNAKFDQLSAENKSGLFSSITNMMGTIFSNEDNNIIGNVASLTIKKFPYQTVNLALLAFYEAVSLNRNFISLLTTTSPEILNDDDDDGGDESCKDLVLQKHLYGLATPNLLVTFLEFSSIVMLGIKNPVTTQTTRLCFFLLFHITEDFCANSLIHDNNMSFMVDLKRMPMRHRKASMDKAKGVRPICNTILDLMNEYILAHLNRSTEQESFLFCLSIIHRLLCFQKRCKVRIQFDWKELWSTLMLLLKFLLKNEQQLLKNQFNIFIILQKIITIFNMFLLYGDNFLHTVVSYDELYYEIIREHTVFQNLNSFALEHLTKETNCDANNENHNTSNHNNNKNNKDHHQFNYKDASSKLTNSLINIKAIIAHFNIKLELYKAQNKIVTLSEEQVLDVVRQNYDTLTLKLTENLDTYEPYNFCKKEELKFFANILTTIIEDFVNTKQYDVTYDEQHNLIAEIQTMSAATVGYSASSTYLVVADPTLDQPSSEN